MSGTLLRLAIVDTLLSGPGAAAAAKDLKERWVERRLIGKEGRKSRDVGGSVCGEAIGLPGRCPVIDDNPRCATMPDGRVAAGPQVPLIPDRFAGKVPGLDGQGADDADGAFRVVGSHGRPRDGGRKLDPVLDADRMSARVAVASRIVKLKEMRGANPGRQDATRRLTGFIETRPAPKPFARLRLDANKATVAEVAIPNGPSFVGLRGPLPPGDRPPSSRPQWEACSRMRRRTRSSWHQRWIKVRASAISRCMATASRSMPARTQAARARTPWTCGTDDPGARRSSATRPPDPGDRKLETLLHLEVQASHLRVPVLLDGGKGHPDGDRPPVRESGRDLANVRQRERSDDGQTGRDGLDERSLRPGH